MSNLEDFIASQYTTLTILTSRPEGQVELVRSLRDGRLLVKKTMERTGTAYPLLYQNHFPGIPPIEQVCETDTKTIVLEEYISGESLDKRLARGALLDDITAANWLEQLCAILRPLHQQGIIHRDIKPSNLICDPGGRLWLIDFDAARSYSEQKREDTVCLGTKGYAPPEQYGYSQTDARSDIYSLGVLTNQLITGRFPGQMLYSGRLSPVIRRAIQLDPANRYQTVEQILAQLYALKLPLQPRAATAVPWSFPQSPPSPNPCKAPIPKKRRLDSFQGANLWRPILFGILTVLNVCVSLTNESLPTLRDHLIGLVQSLILFEPLFLFFIDLFFIRSCPLFDAFRQPGMRKWHHLIYFCLWFLLFGLSIELLRPLYSPGYNPSATVLAF